MPLHHAPAPFCHIILCGSPPWPLFPGLPHLVFYFHINMFHLIPPFTPGPERIFPLCSMLPILHDTSFLWDVPNWAIPFMTSPVMCWSFPISYQLGSLLYITKCCLFGKVVIFLVVRMWWYVFELSLYCIQTRMWEWGKWTFIQGCMTLSHWIPQP